MATRTCVASAVPFALVAVEHRLVLVGEVHRVASYSACSRIGTRNPFAAATSSASG